MQFNISLVLKKELGTNEDCLNYILCCYTAS